MTESTPRETYRLFETALNRLKNSKFRAGFHLTKALRIYAEDKGPICIQEHAVHFIEQRLAPALIPNDGKQTPLKGHPVFIAQHACACCCRDCLYKWYHIPKNRALSPEEQKQIISLLLKWIRLEMQKHPPALPKEKKKPPEQGKDLFSILLN